MNKRLYGLDLIKIVSTILIVFHHYQQITGATWEGINFWSGTFYFGNLVELFFLISGFLMFKYIKRIRQGLGFKSYYLQKLLRFFPLLLICALTTTFFAHVYIIRYGEVFLEIDTYSIWTILISAMGMQAGWVTTNPGINNPTWYISVLLLCSIVLYILIYVSNRLRMSYIYFFIGMIFIGIGIQYYGIELPFLNVYSSRGYSAFFLGLILAYVIKHYGNKKWIFRMSWGIVVGIPILIYKEYWLVLKDIQWIMLFIFYPALIVLACSKEVNGLFSWRWVSKLSEISFNAYMWHFSLFILLYIIISLGIQVDLCSVKGMIGFTVVCYIVGTISHYFYEKPMSRMSDKVRKLEQNEK